MQNESVNSKHSAAPSMQGYIYQCRVALSEMLRKLKENQMVSVTIETLDDVVFEKNDAPIEIIQTKHHINRQANLTDASEDLWRTIGIWIDLFESKSLNSDASFVMITTETALDDSVAHLLSINNRSLDSAIQKLSQTAEVSTNKKTEIIRSKFLALIDEDKKKMLARAYILDASPNCDDIEKELEKILYLTCSKDKISVFCSYLEGWWFQRILKSFSDATKRAILGEEIEVQLNELRESFKSESLPIHSDIKTADVDGALYKDYIFVHQLNMIDVGAKRISIAVNNYYRAFEQRSRWMREELLYVGDIGDYEKLLVEEWETYFETMKDELGETAVEQEKINAAKNLYGWVEKAANIPIKEKCNELFITRGSYQILSDRKVVGWHIEFKERLEKLLELSKEVAQ
ncbi:MAG: ABC-three component system protein [bacterium]